MTKIIYIVGYGHSGSTALASTLGNQLGVGSYGELARLPLHGWLLDFYDSSGKRCSETPFWNEVKSTWLQSSGVESIEHYLQLRAETDRIRRIPALLRHRTHPSPSLAEYGTSTCALFEALSTVSGNAVIVDSSKHAVRALSLLCLTGLDVRLIHLVRDPRGVAWSLSKSTRRDLEAGLDKDRPSKPVSRTAGAWLRQNALAMAVYSRFPRDRRVRVRYEDFANHPAETLARISEMAGVDFSEVGRKVVDRCPLTIEHTIAGNPMRMKRSFTIEYDSRWKEALASRKRLVVSAITLPLLLAYGYAGEQGQG